MNLEENISKKLLNIQSTMIQTSTESDTTQYFTVSIINKTEYFITHVRKIGNNEKITITPPIKKNCSDSCENCFNNKSYDPIIVEKCDRKPFKLQLYLKHQINGSEGWSVPIFYIEPNCLSSNTVLCLKGVEEVVI
jgi:hypothetical protein